MICIGSLIAVICCIVNMVQKRSIGIGQAQLFTRVLSLVWILGGLLFVTELFASGYWGLVGEFGWSQSEGFSWVILFGIVIHGLDVAHL